MSRILLSLALVAVLGLPAWGQAQGQGQTPPADPQQGSPPSSQPPPDASAGQGDASQDQNQQDEKDQKKPKKSKKSRLKDKFSSGCVSGMGCWGDNDKDKDQDKAKQDAGQQPSVGPGAAPAPGTHPADESSSRETHIDLSPPPGESDHSATSPASTVHEMYRYDPHEAAKHVEVGDLYRRQGNYRAAVSRYREALDYKPNDALATIRLAESLEKLNEVEDAAAYYQSYLKILPHGIYAAAAQEALGRLQPLLGGRRPRARSEQGENDLQWGENYLALTNYPGAAERFRHALELMPDDSMAHLRLAQALERMGKAAEAHEHYQAYLTLLPKGPFAADIRRELDKLGTVKAQAGPPQRPDVTPELEAGESELDGGNYAAAAEHFRKALAADPENPRALFRLAQALEATGKRAEALAGYQRYLKVDPNGPFSLDALKALDRLAGPTAQTTSPPAENPPSRR